MSFTRILFTLLVVALFVVACDASTPAPTTAPVQPPAAATNTPVPPPPTAVPPAPTPVPSTPTPAPKPLPPTAVLKIVPVAANKGSGIDKGDPNVMTTTIKMMTDTVAGPYNTVIALGDSGLTNHSLGVPVHLSAAPAVIDAKFPVTKTAWTLTAPPGSKAALKDPAAANTEFTPDVVGIYRVNVTLTNAGGASPVASVQIHADMYIGVEKGNCKQCHPDKVAEWAKTGHAKILTEEIDLKPTHYSESCIRCHSTGYFPGVNNGGFADVQAKLGYQFPTFKQIEAGGNWAKMPADLKNVSNIQCEACHGPAAEHATKGVARMEATQDEGVCNVCHNGGGNHLKGTDLKSAKHSEEASAAWNEPTGPSRQDCVRCHSGDGYASFLKNPTNPAAWDTNKQTVVCATCHDSHSDANAFQLRIVGKAIALPYESKKDWGLAATCIECHNSRTLPANAIKGTFPHYSSIAEMMDGVAGVDYGQKVANSPHGDLVGAAPVLNPAYAKDPTVNKYMFSAIGDEKGNTPGPCVVCHMWPTITDQKDPNWHKVGSHSFNTVSPDGKFAYTESCKACHPNVKDSFNITAKADYDGNGKVEGVQTEVKGLLDVLYKEILAKGVTKNQAGYPYFNVPATADDKVKNAIYNFRTVYGVMWGAATGEGNQGKAQAMHNFKRAVQLLQMSYKDLTGKDVPGATLMTP
ncbi:MAG: hypothetical protein HZB53_00440 [Chloroflexi bacterium]|nr:hypothetical protein [Chloroflexota bacterium]